MRCNLCVLLVAILFMLVSVHAQEDEKTKDQQLQDLRTEVNQLHKDLDTLRAQIPVADSSQVDELDLLEQRMDKRLQELESKIDAVSRSVAPIAFNPKMVTAVNFAARSDNKDVRDPFPGFKPNRQPLLFTDCRNRIELGGGSVCFCIRRYLT